PKPSYELMLQVYVNPKKRGAKRWMEDNLIQQSSSIMRFGIAYSLPFVGRSTGPKESGDITIGGIEGCWINLLASDHKLRRIYLTRERRVVVLSYKIYPDSVEPLASVQQDIYALLVSSLILDFK
ncbi:MAG: hypothetical protein K8S56_02935, partial [Candidatus Cloacimonetes bacterium]|nr:hypothetical protein [Candidatus Cloacimonadota bacterium]